MSILGSSFNGPQGHSGKKVESPQEQNFHHIASEWDKKYPRPRSRDEISDLGWQIWNETTKLQRFA